MAIQEAIYSADGFLQSLSCFSYIRRLKQIVALRETKYQPKYLVRVTNQSDQTFPVGTVACLEPVFDGTFIAASKACDLFHFMRDTIEFRRQCFCNFVCKGG